MRHLDLFSGIGGFAYAARTVWGDEYRNIGFCEIDPFCQAVLRKNFPSCTIWEDIRTLADPRSEEQHRLSGSTRKTIPEIGDSRLNLITGGFPCQPFSHAGRRRGTSDDRYLWPEMFAVIRRFQPTWVIAENVSGLVSWNEGLVLEQVCSDLENEGYEVQPFIIPAVSVNAPHRRDRVWIVAHNSSEGLQGELYRPRKSESRVQETAFAGSRVNDPDATDTSSQRRQQESRSTLSHESEDERGTTQDNHEPSGHNQSSIANSRSQRWSKRANENIRPSLQEPIGSDSEQFSWECDWKEIAFATCYDRMDDGLSKRMVRLPNGNAISPARWRKEALKAYGNAICPQVAIEIMKAIKEVKNG